MEESYKKLVNSEGSHAKCESDCRGYISTGLLGINNEDIVYRYTDDIASMIHYIKGDINNVKCALSYNELVLIDALASATIEGAETTLEDVKKHVDFPSSKDEKMVTNTFKCQNFLYSNDIGVDNIRSIWARLVFAVCDNENLKGDIYRSGMVYVGSHIPEKPDKIESKMNSLFDLCDRRADSILKACIVHFYFVYIYPFCDGNGRFARMWMNKILYGVNPKFIYLSISKGVLSDINGYYSSLEESEYSYGGIIDMTPFMEYMLKVICDILPMHTVSLSDLDHDILSLVDKDGLTLNKLHDILGINKSRLRYSATKLVEHNLLNVDMSNNEYRYYKGR